MAIKINWQDLQKRIINWQEVQKVMLNWSQIRPSSPVVNDYLCFEPATIEWCEIGLIYDLPIVSHVQLEISYNKSDWSDYSFGSTISLNYWQKVYWRNKSETQTGFSWAGRYFHFSINWRTNASWDINYLLCKNSTRDLTDSWTSVFAKLFAWCSDLVTSPSLSADIITGFCYDNMFSWCSWLIAAPQLPAMTLAEVCYQGMFEWCTWLTVAPQLPATTLADACYYMMFKWCTWLITSPQLSATNTSSMCYNRMFEWCTSLMALPQLPSTSLVYECYRGMFSWCVNIKISDTQSWEYQTSYRIPSQWTGTDGSNSLRDMFSGTRWTFTWTPNINQTYYTSNQVI